MGCASSVDRDSGTTPPAKTKESSVYDRRKTPAPPGLGLGSSSSDASDVAFDSAPGAKAASVTGLHRTSSSAALETSAPLAAAVAELSNAISELDALAFQDKKQQPQGPQLVATLRAFAIAADNAHRHGTLALAHCRLVHLAVRDLLVAGRAGCLDAVLQLSVSQDLQQALVASWCLLEVLTDDGSYLAAALSRFATAFTMRTTFSPTTATTGKAKNVSDPDNGQLPTAVAASGTMLVAAVQRLNAEVLGNAVRGGVAAAGGAASAAALQQAHQGLKAAQSGLVEAVADLRRRVEEGSGAQLPQQPKPEPVVATAAVARGEQDGGGGGEPDGGEGGAAGAAIKSTGDAADVLEVLRAFMDKCRMLKSGDGSSGSASSGSSCGGAGACDPSNATGDDLNLPASVVAAAEALERMQQVVEDCPQQRWLLLRQPGAGANGLAADGAGDPNDAADSVSFAAGGGSRQALEASPSDRAVGYRFVLAPNQPESSELGKSASVPTPSWPRTAAQRPSAALRQCMAFVPRVERRAVMGHMEVVRGHVCSFQPRFRVRVPELAPVPLEGAGAAVGAVEGAQAGGGETGGYFVVCGGHAGHFKGYEHVVEPLE